MRTIAPALALAAVLAPAAAAEPVVRLIDPVDTGPGILPLEDFQDPPAGDTLHRAAIDPDAPIAGRLFVFLPGSGGLPSFYTLIVRHAASMGYHAIGLTYPNDPSVRDLIAGETDPELPEKIRRERLFGESLTPKVDVDAANSIRGRLVALLTYLDAQHPGEGWGSFVTLGDEPRWDAIVVSGHSQGAGHAAFLTKTDEPAGVVMFAGPGDFVTGVGPAPWLDAPSLIPARRLLAFTHEDDPPFAGFLLNQRTLGLADVTPPQYVDGLRPIDIYAQSMASALASVDPVDAHGAVVVDAKLPRTAGGANAYEPVWTALLAWFLPDPCPGDVDGSGAVDVFDFSALASAFGQAPAPRSSGDLNRDGVVDVFDFAILAGRFGATCNAP
jgi:hypothetical protein